MAIERALLALLGATLPFPQFGVPLNQAYVLSVSAVAGLLYAVLRLLRQGLTGVHLAALCMLIAFAASAALRHPPASYLLSLGALTLGLAPATVPAWQPKEVAALTRGMMVGLRVTLALMGLNVLPQLLGVEGLLGPLRPLLIRPEAGAFLGYVRPAAGFVEPSHLAIYLCAVFVVLDLMATERRPRHIWRAAVGLGVVFTGSVSGVLLLLIYALARLLADMAGWFAGGWSLRSTAKATLVAGAVAGVLALAASTDSGLVADYMVRIVRAQEDIETVNLVGSEGSRANAVLALPDYWEAEGWPGFLVGTGYANYEPWLLANYGDLGDWSTFARGEIDNVLVAVFLSTGLLGFGAFIFFLVRVFGFAVLRRQLPVFVFVLGINFVYGFLISGFYWGAMFLLASTARYARTRPRHRPAVSSTPGFANPQGSPPAPST